MALQIQEVIDAHKADQMIPENEKEPAKKPTDQILDRKYPGHDHAKRVVSFIRDHLASNQASKEPTNDDISPKDVDDAILYLEATRTQLSEDSDHAAPFRQRRYFYYLTGCELPDSAYIYNVKTAEATLFIPGIDKDEVVWNGLPLSKEEALEKYDVSHVRTMDELNSFLSGKELPRKTVFAIGKQISDSVSFSSYEKKNLTILKEAIEECRVVKDEFEIALIRKANEISDLAHRAVMRKVKHVKNERELEAVFVERCIAHGCHEQAYSPIVASGTDAATLHYVKNNKAIATSNINLLVDAGGEYNMYAADITRTFPTQGQFTRGSAAIYKLVLKMQKSCIARLVAGVLWDDVHTYAHKILIEGFLELGLMRGQLEEILEARTSCAFFPHGLGHYLGMDTHDTGGHANYSDADPMFRYLRVRGKLPTGSVITVEPGIYFCRFIIEPYLKDEKHAQYINADLLEGYWQVGGVRIEDNILITEEGHENLTIVPKEVNDIEDLINSSIEDQVSEYPPAVQ